MSVLWMHHLQWKSVGSQRGMPNAVAVFPWYSQYFTAGLTYRYNDAAGEAAMPTVHTEVASSLTMRLAKF